MAKQDGLAQVEQDIERGHTHLALRRLAELATEHPDDLEIRAVRGLVNHRIGNFAEAGRWGFLTEEVDEADLAAFERAFRHPWDRLRALKLRYDPASVLGPRARERLAELVAKADESGADSLVWTESGPFPRGPWWARALGSGCGCLAVAGVIVLIGFCRLWFSGLL